MPDRTTFIRLKSRVIALVALGMAVSTAAAQNLEIVRSFVRADGAYKVILFRKPLPAVMPGQAGDAPGVVRLYDGSDRLLAEADVEMVQLVEDVDWSNDKASIKLVVEWELSRLVRRPPPSR